MRRKAIATGLAVVSFLLSAEAVQAGSAGEEGPVRLAQGMMGGGMMRGGMMGGGMMGGSALRHRFVMQNGVPPQYRELRNPLAPTPANIRAGQAHYQTYCASCHGQKGYGNGPAAAQLNPPPANLARAMRTPMATDPYLYWTMAEGGTPVGSAMPAFKEVLSPEQAWQIVLFLRQL